MTVMTPEAFQSQLENLPELKAFPPAASKLLSEFDDPNLSPKRIAEIVSCDPAIAGYLLQTANSPLYGYVGQIRTIEHSVVVLGMRSVRNAVLTIAGAAVFSSGKEAMAERKTLWKHSLEVATIGRVLSKYVNVPAEEAFLAGVFHDVGKLVIFDLASAAYVEGINPRWQASERVSWELEQFGVNHATLGMECADDWGLPADIADAIGHHHELEEINSPLCVCTAAANLLAPQWQLQGEEFAVDTDDPELWETQSSVIAELGVFISSASLVGARHEAYEHFQDVMKTLG